jgi:hypothetical protein
MTQDDEDRQIESLHEELLREYGPVLGEQTVSSRFAAIVAEFEGAPVRTFVPLLAERKVHQELRAAAASA